jgi:NADPH-dependent glutamate synthase beta subunit-like oxidoreductase/CO/xanthine dehydrogenase FAD-binding subunit
MKKFKHISPRSLDEATAVLEEYGCRARVIAGGTDLLGEMKDCILPASDYPEVLVDIKRIADLDYVRDGDGNGVGASPGGGLRIGALTKLEDLATDSLVLAKYPALAEAAHRTASPHIREMGTVAGNICQNNRCWYYWVQDNLFECLRKGGKACYALTGDARYHSIFGAARVAQTACSQACPNSIDIPTYLGKIREGDTAGAAAILLRQNPLPSVTGRVCPHSCENNCARGEFDEPVSIREVERFLGDQILEAPAAYYKAPAKTTGKRVAVVGAGPAGLSAAHYLRSAGHDVTIFEKMPEAGGLLNYGIPPYRLPRDLLRKQIGAIESEGVKFVLGTEVDAAKFGELQKAFDAIFLGTGAWQATASGIEGEQCLTSGTEFLRSHKLDPDEMAGKNVVIIGGGNTAIDVARSLLRLGAKPTIMYRRTRAEMPAIADDVRKAEEEGVKFEFLTTPVAAEEQGGEVELTCCRMELGDLDTSGRPRPVKVEGSEFAFPCDAVMTAIVEKPDYSLLPAGFLDDKGRLVFDKASQRVGGTTGSAASGTGSAPSGGAASGGAVGCGAATGLGVYAGGDFVTGPATVAEAVNAGHVAARSINKLLMGEGAALPGEAPDGRPEAEAPVCTIGQDFHASCMQPSGRVEVPELSLSERVRSLTAEETGTLEPGAVKSEADRCFNCGCVAVNSSDLAPALVALGAQIKTSRRMIDAEDFFSAAVNSSTVLEAGEMVVEVQVPEPATGARSAFLKFAMRKSIDFPVVNCAAALVVDGAVVTSARICLNSVYGIPVRVSAAERYLAGKKIDQAAAEAAADAAIEGAIALLNNRYKIQIARTLVKRTILACG